MRNFLFIAFVSLFLSGCVARYQGVALQSLTVNGKKNNSKIQHRFPDYGDGHTDGCVIMPEMEVAIRTNSRGVSGIVNNIETGIALTEASIIVVVANERRFIGFADSSGKFQIDFDGRLSSLRVSCLGYRSLLADFDSRKLGAE